MRLYEEEGEEEERAGKENVAQNYPSSLWFGNETDSSALHKFKASCAKQQQSRTRMVY